MNNIVVIAPVDPFQSKVGGTRNYVMNFIHAAQSDNRIVLYGYTNQRNRERRIHDNVIFHAVIYHEDGTGRYIIPPSIRFICKLTAMRNIIRKSGEVLHFHRFDYTLPFLFPVKRARIVVYFHGAASKGYLMGRGVRSKLKGVLYLFLEHLILPRIDRIITVSVNDERYYKERYPHLKDKITTIPVPLNLETFKLVDNRKALCSKYDLSGEGRTVIFAGRFSKVKGIDLIIRAFAELNKEMPESHLLLVGQGEEERSLRKLVSDLNVKNVRFLDPIPHDAMPEILNCSDVLVLASHTEGMPTVILEALACGVPVISTNVGDIPQVIRDDKIGFIIHDRNISEMKDLMRRALDMSDTFKEERLRVASEFSAVRLSQNIVEIHRKLAE